ncbi:MAG: repeat protein [Polyangiaceae bacterium]|nr:repeat protein [Polyangiaceae bacterium]
MASSCGAPPCSAAPVSLGVPPALRGKPARAQVVSLGSGRRATVVTVVAGWETFQAVVVAPLGAGAPKVLFSGLVGLREGQEGTRSGPMVQVSEPAADGTRRVLVGEQHEAASLCGRPTILAPQLLNPADLSLRPAKVQRLSVAERDAARTVTAVRIPDDEPSHAARSVLGALAASSALGAPQALTDGDPETVWSENVGGDGKGEFVTMHAPSDLPISGLELTIRPKAKELAEGAAPERLFIAGPRDVVAVTLPEDAWKSPGARYRVNLSPPLQGSCLALVLDTAFTQSKSAQVSVAELSVLSELSASQLPELVASLAGGGQRAEASKSLLVAGGAPAFAAVAQAFDGLDEGGKRVALTVLDQAPCEVSAPVYVAALTGKIEAQARHAQSRLGRCGAAGGNALAQALAKADKTDKRVLPLLVSQLTLTDPARAVTAFLPLMDEKTVLRRRLLRTALAQAARTAPADKTVRAALADPATPPVALLDLLRALGEEASRYQPEAGQALQRISQTSAEFRTRYLLLGPTAALSARDQAAESAFRKSLAGDPSPHVRAAALALVREPKRFQGELLKALEDRDVRVREAAVQALGGPDAVFAGKALSLRLEQDEWPLVRAAAADALAKHPASPVLDEPLTSALEDDSSLVRARSVRALGERRVTSAAGRIRDRLEDAEEWPEVRAEAARSLGVLCDGESADILAAFAKKLTDPMASPHAQLIGNASVQALGRLAQPSLAQQLAPLTDKKAPPQARRAAALALQARVTCKR